MKNKTWPKGTRIIRQLLIYYQLKMTVYHGPADIMQEIPGLHPRMLQRDIQDLRDAGLISIRYERKTKNYVDSDKAPAFNTSVTGKRQSHLIRLKRLGTLLFKLESTYAGDVEEYMEALEIYEDSLQTLKEEPENFFEEDLEEKPEPPDLLDARTSYHQLFPECSDRTMQRDFKDLNATRLMKVDYCRKLHIYLVYEKEELYEYFY